VSLKELRGKKLRRGGKGRPARGSSPRHSGKGGSQGGEKERVLSKKKRKGRGGPTLGAPKPLGEKGRDDRRRRSDWGKKKKTAPPYIKRRRTRPPEEMLPGLKRLQTTRNYPPEEEEKNLRLISLGEKGRGTRRPPKKKERPPLNVETL